MHTGAEAARRIVLVGIGGASCSGKTTLARHLLRVLPEGSLILHQDDFAPPDSQIPIHPVHGIQDWDDPEGAIDWPRLTGELRNVAQSGKLPQGHVTYDYLYAQKSVPVQDELISSWQAKYRAAAALQNTLFVLVDGFLMYWNEEVTQAMEMRFFVREKKETLRQRREERKGYVTAEAFWEDPPGYFDDIVWPAYTKAHAHLFANDDVEAGELSERAQADGMDMHLLEASKAGMDGMVREMAEAIYGRFA